MDQGSVLAGTFTSLLNVTFTYIYPYYRITMIISITIKPLLNHY